MNRVRVRNRDLPDTDTHCSKPCVYRKDGICDNPQVNKLNTDSSCNRENNRDTLARLSDAAERVISYGVEGE